MCKPHTKQWTQQDVVEGVSTYFRNCGRAHLRAELQKVLDCSRSYADKLVLGQLSSIPSATLLTLNAHFGGELLRTLLGYNEDEASRKIAFHLEQLKRLTT